MSKFSEMAGSFIRMGSFPMEANYIFSTEQELKEFYLNPINRTTLHKGLLRVVESDDTGNQSLYWVKQVGDDLQFNKLISDPDIESIFTQLNELEIKLSEEIENRKTADDTIYGTEDSSIIPEDLDSIIDLSNAITELRDKTSILKNEVKALAGTNEEDVVEYLKTLPYHSLTEVSEALNKFLNTVDSSNTQINTLPELKSFLSGYSDTQKLEQVLDTLKQDILGTPTPSKEFLTLRAIEDFIRIFKVDSEYTDRNIQTELNQTQIGIGLSNDGSFSPDKETTYLKDATSVMNALKILDSLIDQAISANLVGKETSTNTVTITKDTAKTTIAVDVKVSSQTGNGIQKNSDGLYHSIDLEYSNGILSTIVNGQVKSQLSLGLSSIVEDAYYEASTENIVIIFKLDSGESQRISIPVSGLIEEIQIDNNDKSVTLTKTRNISGKDYLSAEVNISNSKDNILEKEGNVLIVRGTSDNITHNDTTLSEVLNQIINEQVTVYYNLSHALQHNPQNGNLFITQEDDELGKKGLYVIFLGEAKRLIFEEELGAEIQSALDWYFEE